MMGNLQDAFPWKARGYLLDGGLSAFCSGSIPRPIRSPGSVQCEHTITRGPDILYNTVLGY